MERGHDIVTGEILGTGTEVPYSLPRSYLHTHYNKILLRFRSRYFRSLLTDCVSASLFRMLPILGTNVFNVLHTSSLSLSLSSLDIQTSFYFRGRSRQTIISGQG